MVRLTSPGRRRRGGRRPQPAACGLEARGNPDLHDAIVLSDAKRAQRTRRGEARAGAVADVESRLVDRALDLVAVEHAILQRHLAAFSSQPPLLSWGHLLFSDGAAIARRYRETFQPLAWSALALLALPLLAAAASWTAEP